MVQSSVVAWLKEMECLYVILCKDSNEETMTALLAEQAF